LGTKASQHPVLVTLVEFLIFRLLMTNRNGSHFVAGLAGEYAKSPILSLYIETFAHS
jgi:hypothetical protein